MIKIASVHGPELEPQNGTDTMKAPILEIIPPISSELTADEEKMLKEWESEINGLVFKTIHLLAKIKEYKGGKLWKARGHKSFAEYVQAQFGHSAAHAGRLDKAGSFVHLLEEKGVLLRSHSGKARYAPLSKPYRIRIGFLVGKKSRTSEHQRFFK